MDLSLVVLTLVRTRLSLSQEAIQHVQLVDLLCEVLLLVKVAIAIPFRFKIGQVRANLKPLRHVLHFKLSTTPLSLKNNCFARYRRHSGNQTHRDRVVVVGVIKI